MSQVFAIIPARWGSERFPGKPLHPIAGKPLVQHVWERCREAGRLDRTLLATDDKRIASAAEAFGAEVVMTRSDHPTGTDRLAEAVGAYPECTHVINVQGDEPLIDPGLIDQLAETLLNDPALPMVTAANPIADHDQLADPNIVKVVLNKRNNALYFSRSVIPHDRTGQGQATWFRHQGIYGYTREFLLAYVRWDPSPLEVTEKLEQLRALENGASIAVVLTDHDSIGVDTPAQAEHVATLLPPRP